LGRDFPLLEDGARTELRDDPILRVEACCLDDEVRDAAGVDVGDPALHLAAGTAARRTTDLRVLEVRPEFLLKPCRDRLGDLLRDGLSKSACEWRDDVFQDSVDATCAGNEVSPS
jgi:hypothetical protein